MPDDGVDRSVGPAADDDARLMALIARGDQAAFEQLIHRHQRRVYNIIFRSVRNGADAEDLVQEVFLRVYRAADRYQPTAKFTTWLYRVTTNAVINWLRRQDRQPVTLSRVTAGHDDDSEPTGQVVDPDGETGLDALTRGELQARVRQAVEALPPNQRLAVALFRFEGQSYQDIAEAMECSVMAVKSLLSRARENLRQRLGPYVGDFSAFSPEHGHDTGGSTE